MSIAPPSNSAGTLSDTSCKKCSRELIGSPKWRPDAVSPQVHHESASLVTAKAGCWVYTQQRSTVESTRRASVDTLVRATACGSTLSIEMCLVSLINLAT